MPIYEYKCSECGYKFEKLESFSDNKKSKCPQCGGEARRLISLAGFVLKGTGWYVTDYPSKERKKGMEQEKTAAKESKPTQSESSDKTKKKSE